MWRFADVHEGESYRLHLCAGKSGDRTIRLVAIGSEADIKPDEDVFLITEIVHENLNKALKLGNLTILAEKVLLENGEPFFVDDHGIWEAVSEARQRDSGMRFGDVQWITGQAPKLPPR